ncbi:hypothetical protein ASF01_01155 [Stenotrophomonas sp. Leaf70]|uniref:ESPR-type extended signal peptide-containing protein n=1 Tax=Stenotrophomonas sp. Leaf70 TaxID=1736233 RepID=UPI0006FD9175|nr:ESPR-type extended signal peptide-containing protein [Stenotrophomonas sp. Leaf70]KQO02367.1 hypothetical protein ASF01_01155 [Stenotrophomonas sp. Leaf70]
MNRIYRLVWNRTLNAFVVGSELASAAGKHAGARRLQAGRTGVSLGMGSLLMLAMASPAQAGDARLDDLQALVAKYAAQDASMPAVPMPGASVAGVPAASTAHAPLQVGSHLGQAVPALSQTVAVVTAPVAAVAASTSPLQVTAAAKATLVKPVAHVVTGATKAVATLPGIAGKLPQALVLKEDGVAGGIAGTAQAGLQALGSVLSPGRDDNGGNPLRNTLVSTATAVEELTGGLVKGSHVGALLDGVVEGSAPVLEGVGDKAGTLVGQLTGSAVLGNGLSQTVVTATQGLQATTGALGQGNVGGAAQSLLGAVGGTVSAATGTVTGTLSGLAGSASGLGGLQQLIDGVAGGLTGGASNVVGQLTGQPAAAAGGGAATGARPTGLVVGNGGLVGTVGQLAGPTLSTLFGGDGYVRNGGLAMSNANIAQAYSVTTVAGLPMVNLSPVGQVLDGLGGLATGGNSHMTLIGGVTSGNYIYNINNGKPNGLLGLVLPDGAPAWAAKCADPLGLGLVKVDCWGVNAAQDYQVLIGDGAYANGSKEVVIGTNAEHRLAQQDANTVFPGAGGGANGVPTADYDARLGHSVVIGDSASGSANGQTLIGAGATSDKANSVALGYKSNADRGGRDGYTAFGLAAPQNSIGEVAVGSAGRERQITHVAAGLELTDAVNVAQLKGALSLIAGVSQSAVTYDDDAQGNPDYGRVTLGGGNAPQGTVVGNLAAGAVAAGSMQAVNGGQLHGLGMSLAALVGGGATLDANGALSMPTYGLNAIGANGQLSLNPYAGLSAAFGSISDSLANLRGLVVTGTPANGGGTGNVYFAVNSSKAAASASGQDSMAAGPQSSASGAQSVALGDGATATADGSVALGAGSVADRANSVSVGSTGHERQVTHVADGSEATDAVNLRQLQASQQGTVRYDQNGDGSTDYGSVTLGQPGKAVVMHNVGTGVAGTDAVNVAQLNKGLGDVMDWSKNYTDQRFGDIGRDINRVDNRASAGIASAMAMAGLPQPTEAGRRMASFAASTFHGESSMAVGISGVTEGGRWIYKLSGSANTRGDGGVTVGAGIQW